MTEVMCYCLLKGLCIERGITSPSHRWIKIPSHLRKSSKLIWSYCPNEIVPIKGWYEAISTNEAIKQNNQMPNLFRFQLTLIVQIKQITPQQVNIPWNANVIFVNVKAQTVLSSYWTCTTMTYQWRWIGHYGQWLMRGDRTGQWYPDCLLVLFAAIIRRLPGFICRNHCQRRRIASCPLALPTSCLSCLCLSILLPVSNFHFFEPNLQIVRVMKSVWVCAGVYARVCVLFVCVCVRISHWWWKIVTLDISHS